MARRRFTPEQARERHLARCRDYQKRKRAGLLQPQHAPALHDQRVEIEPPPAEVLIERDQRLRLMHSSPTQALLGDPV